MVQLLFSCVLAALAPELSISKVSRLLSQDPVIVTDPSPSDIVLPTTPSGTVEGDAATENPESAGDAAAPSDLSVIDPSGCWSGSWQSCKSGHHGVLRATLTPCGEHAYRAEFRGRFFKIMPFRYSVTLKVVGVDEDGIHLAGSQSLGRLFGTFHYTATLTECRFEARYNSCKDWGKFSLCR